MIAATDLLKRARLYYSKGLFSIENYATESLQSAQSEFQKHLGEYFHFDDSNNDSSIYHLSDNFAMSYIVMCNALNTILLVVAQEDEVFDYSQRYSPSYINIEQLRQITGLGKFVFMNMDKCDTRSCYKYEMRHFVSQCIFTILWSCLLNSILSPDIPEDLLDAEIRIGSFLLNSDNEFFVHKIIIECKDLDSRLPIADRGSKQNTSRIKILLYSEDGIPFIVRFDLPHKGRTSPHINILTAEGKEYHFDLASSNSAEKLYDDFYRPFIDSILNINPNGIEFRSSPPEEDKDLLLDVSINLSMAMIAPYIIGEKLGIEGSPTLQELPYIENCITFLKDNIKIDDTSHYSDVDVFDCMDIQLSR